MYKLKHFDIREFVPPQVFAARGERSIELMDDRVLITADQLREHFGIVIINTWWSQKLIAAYGLRTESGLRLSGTATGAAYSQHKYGRAVDCLIPSTTAAAVRKYVLANPDQFPYINCIEDLVSWFHYDVRNCERIKVVKP